MGLVDNFAIYNVHFVHDFCAKIGTKTTITPSPELYPIFSQLSMKIDLYVNRIAHKNSIFINCIKLETQKLGFFRRGIKFWIYHMHQVVKKETGAKIYWFLLYKAETLALRLCNLMIVEYEARIHQKKAILRDFR